MRLFSGEPQTLPISEMVAVEGATHGFTPCADCPGAPFGDTVKRLFDFVGSWLSKSGRF